MKTRRRYIDNFSNALALALVAILIGCSTARRGEPVAGALSLDDPILAHGHALFAQYCHICHPGGAAGLGPAINNKPLPGFLLRLQVRQGLGAMPAFDEETISKTDLDALVAYLHALRANTPLPKLVQAFPDEGRP